MTIRHGNPQQFGELPVCSVLVFYDNWVAAIGQYGQQHHLVMSFKKKSLVHLLI